MKGARGGKPRGPNGSGKGHKAFCQAQAAAGKINTADGNWVTRDNFVRLPGVQSDTVARDYFAGYKLA